MRRKLFSAPITLALLLCFGASASAKVAIHIDLSTQRITIVKNHEAPVVWKISSGRAGYETPAGNYSVYRMEPDHYSDEYEQAPMPYALFFSPRGLAIHGTYQSGLGQPRSHGCVRLSVDHARELYGWVEHDGGASVEITGEASGYARYRDEEPRPRHSRQARSGDDQARSGDNDELKPLQARVREPKRSRSRHEDDDYFRDLDALFR